MRILCNNNGKNLAYLKPHDTMQRPGVSKYGLQILLSIFWNSFGVLHDVVSEMSLMATPYGKYHKLTKVTNKYCSLNDKNCGSLRLQDNALKHTTNQRKPGFLH